MAVFAMLAALMFVSKKLMEALPNVHLLGLLIMTTTVVFRAKALWPLYVYVLADGIMLSFSPWWVPYLYVWAILWGVTMLLPRRMPRPVAMVVYPAVCGLFGLAFGTLYAPGFALLFGLDFHGMLAWIVNGLPFDVIHGVSNLLLGTLVLPLSDLLRRLAGSSTRT